MSNPVDPVKNKGPKPVLSVRPKYGTPEYRSMVNRSQIEYRKKLRAEDAAAKADNAKKRERNRKILDALDALKASKKKGE